MTLGRKLSQHRKATSADVHRDGHISTNSRNSNREWAKTAPHDLVEVRGNPRPAGYASRHPKM
jgi:hypothetical protein